MNVIHSRPGGGWTQQQCHSAKVKVFTKQTQKHTSTHQHMNNDATRAARSSSTRKEKGHIHDWGAGIEEGGTWCCEVSVCDEIRIHAHEKKGPQIRTHRGKSILFHTKRGDTCARTRSPPTHTHRHTHTDTHTPSM